MTGNTSNLTSTTKSIPCAQCAGSGTTPASDFTAMEVEGFLKQVTTDFEELTWLRNLATHIELCDVRNEVQELAAAVLPELGHLIAAEALVLITVGTPAAGSRVAHTTGSTDVATNDLHTLISQHGVAALAQPVVRNLQFGIGILADFRNLRNFILVPVGQGKYQYGWLLVINKVCREPDEAHRQIDAQSYSESEFGTFEAGMVNAAAVLLGSHAKNLAMFREQEQLFKGLVKALINTIEAKDPYTHGHSDRVAQMARCLASGLRMPDAECDRIYMTGLLHDIGKIGVPDEVLQKPGKLNNVEFDLIKKHPDIGCSIVEHLPQLAYALPGIRHHHESFDGTGYPGGLAGDAIPFSGRLLAVVDAYDAMTSNRPYRPGMPTSRAEEILQKGSGQQWDPRIVAAFFEVLPDLQAICSFAASEPRVQSTPALSEISLTQLSQPLAMDILVPF